jgi:hypothetical protein
VFGRDVLDVRRLHHPRSATNPTFVAARRGDWLRRNRHKHPLGLVESVGPAVRPLFMMDGSKALSKSILRAFEHATARHGERSKQKGQKREIVGSPLIGGNRDRVCAATYP